MSGHWVFACPKGRYVGTRKNNGNMYESRTVLADSLADARVFNTKGAATRAGNDCGAKGDAVEVTVSLSAPTATLSDDREDGQDGRLGYCGMNEKPL